jgi:hypothetical protein
MAFNPFRDSVTGRRVTAPRGALLNVLSLAVGTRVRVMQTIAPHVGIVRGAMGTVVGFLYHKGTGSPCAPGASSIQALESPEQLQIPLVLVQFDEDAYTGETWWRHLTLGTVERVVPIGPVKWRMRHQGVEYTREMLPLEPAMASTVHAAQGSTVSAHVMIPPGGEYADFARALLYVALSRVTNLTGLFLIRHLITAKMFTKWEQQIARISEEYTRLRNLQKWCERSPAAAAFAAAAAAVPMDT